VAGAAALTAVVADAVGRARDLEAGAVPSAGGADLTDQPAVPSEDPQPSRRAWRWARRVGGSAAVTAIASATVAAASTMAARTAGKRLFERRLVRDLGAGPLALLVAIFGWDFIYYWNHRWQHESRFMWAIHVVHHSSEKYNLSTALRQPWADSLGIFLPYGLLALGGVRPDVIETARQLNLLYQYWIHTDTIGKLGRWEQVLNTPSHHRAHHGSNQRYLDRNHGSILIVWDRLFGTFQPEDERDPVVYGLTKNIDTFNPLRIATHEYAEIARDVYGATTWRDRLSFVFRGPGWAYDHHPDRAGGEAHHADPAGELGPAPEPAQAGAA
jgi:sterol desaturase/sphingolipid hydroxylase (fatty acid hydroxylase superfamily)